MAMTSNQKGYNAQRKTAKYLESLGFQVHTVARPSYRNSHDIFGLWDHIAIANQPTTVNGLIVPAGQTLYVQTKSRKIYGKDVLPYVEFSALYKLAFVWLKGENGRYYLHTQIFSKEQNVNFV